MDSQILVEGISVLSHNVVFTLQQPGYDIIAQFMIGYVLPGKPIANLLFKMYGRISTIHALSFLADLKLGHYMKIPPRCMYVAQVWHCRNLYIWALKFHVLVV
jgi:hypothetical protein